MRVKTSLVAAPAPTIPFREIVRRFWPFAARRKGWMLVALLIAAIGPLLTSVEIWLFKVVVDDVLIPKDFGAFPIIAALYIGLTLVQSVFGGASRMLSTWLTQRFLVDVRQALLRHLERLPLDFFSRNRLGDLMARVSGDVSAIESFLVSGTTSALTYLLELVFFTIALFVLDPSLALLSLVVTPLFWLTSRYFSKRLKAVSREKQRRSGSISSSIEQTLSNMPLVQAYDQGDREVARYLDEAEAKYRAEMASARLRSIYSPTVEMIELVGVLTVIGAGAWMLSRGQLTVGELLAFLTFLSRLYSPIRGLGSTVTSAYSAAAGAERVIELLDQPTLPDDRQGALTLERPRGDLRLHDVSFSYPGSATPALSGVSFSVAPGDIVAVVGASGAGKSTLARLIMRSYDPGTGSVSLDGHDLRDLTRATVREHLAVVLQETLIVDGTIRDNIAYGRPGAGQDAIEAAARQADAHDFIVSLPEGYDTHVGERGRRISGGQAQRVAIARALLRDAPVLLLDEPTTGLDAGSADRVTAPLRRLMSGRATIVISHNLMTVREATTIVVLHEGRIVERGTHATLVAAGGRYAELWRASGLARETPTELVTAR